MKKIVMLLFIVFITIGCVSENNYESSYIKKKECGSNAFLDEHYNCSCINGYVKESNNASGFNCILKTKYDDKSLEELEKSIGCYFQDTFYDLPDNARCLYGDPYNAWKCNEGYYESGNRCIKSTKQLNTLSTPCNIKGNISYNSKTKVYYLPECGRYSDVKIHPQYGERWFCSEQEAINAGWIKSYRCP